MKSPQNHLTTKAITHSSHVKHYSHYNKQMLVAYITIYLISTGETIKKVDTETNCYYEM